MAKTHRLVLYIYLAFAFCVIYTDAATHRNFTYVCDPARYAQLGLDVKSLPFCDKKLSYQVRARDLVRQMTLYEKVRQLGNHAYGVPRLGIPEYEWWSEALHGLSNVKKQWPKHIGLSFISISLLLSVSSTLMPRPIETSPMYVIPPGMPNLDWMSNHSPFVTRNFSYQVRARDLVRQMTLYEKVRQLGNHAYGVPRLGIPEYEWWSEALHGLSNVGPGHAGLTFWSPTINVARDPRWGRIIETPGEDPFVVGTYAANYMRGLQDVEGTESNKYKDLNSRPLKVSACCKHFTAYDVDNWKGIERYTFDAEFCKTNITIVARYIVADCDSVEVMVKDHKWLNVDNETAVSYTLQAGLDLDCGVYYTNNVENAVKHGKVGEGDVDQSLQYLYVVLMRLGIFDGQPQYNSLGEAVDAVKTADATVIVAGIDLSIEAETRDRLDILLPGKQTDLINQVADAAKGPVVLVIMSAGGVDISFAKSNPKIHAILWAGYPGAEGGQATANVVFGKYNPGGRLPLTWYQADYVDKIPLTSLQLRPDDSKGYPGRTYKFFDGPTVFPFGYGLSYTKFNYALKAAPSKLTITLSNFQHCRDLPYKNGTFKTSCPAVLIDDLSCNKEFKFDIEVKNAGDGDGDEIVLVYSQPPLGILRTHIKQLNKFQRVSVAAGASKLVRFAINICQGLGIVDSNGNAVLPSGSHTIIVGDHQIVHSIQLTYR
ncbi:putative beta-d-xylosidase 2 [Quercus suber]|uniref:Beta-d-xylosidase 2 n=1 Tax=Quercus suber TaxID=58331 RepID=A0AAW0JFH5_QUESU